MGFSPHYKIFTVAVRLLQRKNLFIRLAFNCLSVASFKRSMNRFCSSKVKILSAVGFLFGTFSLPTKEKVHYVL